MKRTIALALIAAGAALAQKAPYPNANSTFLTTNSQGYTVPCGGCSLYTYVAGGTTPQATYPVAGGGTANANPIVLNSEGRADVWTTPGLSYRFDLYDATAVLIWSVDNVPGGSLVGSSSVTANYLYAGPTTGAAAAPTFRPMVTADLPSAVSLISSNFGSQGTTTTVLHGNAGGVLAFGNVVPADFGASVTARSVLGNRTAAAAAPTMETTVDVLAYQVAEIPSFVWVTTDFTTAASTALQTITGLSWTIPASTAINMPFICNLIFHQNTAAVAVAFGIQDVTISPTNITAKGEIYTNTTAVTAGNLVGLATTAATAIVSATPSAITTDWNATVTGFIEAPSNATASAINLMVSTAAAGDAVVVKRGSFCRLN